MSEDTAEEGNSTILERVILRDVPGAQRAYVDGEFAYVQREGEEVVWRLRLSPEAKRIHLLEREGRYRDIQPGEVVLLPVLSDETPT